MALPSLEVRAFISSISELTRKEKVHGGPCPLLWARPEKLSMTCHIRAQSHGQGQRQSCWWIWPSVQLGKTRKWVWVTRDSLPNSAVHPSWQWQHSSPCNGFSHGQMSWVGRRDPRQTESLPRIALNDVRGPQDYSKRCPWSPFVEHFYPSRSQTHVWCKRVWDFGWFQSRRGISEAVSDNCQAQVPDSLHLCEMLVLDKHWHMRDLSMSISKGSREWGLVFSTW